MIRRIYLLLLLSLASALFASNRATAQTLPILPVESMSYDADAIQGRILVKLTLEAYTRSGGEGDFSSVAGRFGIYRVIPWINPKLLAAQTGLYRRNTPSGLSKEAGLRRILVVEYSSLDAPEELVKALERNTDIEFVEVLHPRKLCYTPNDPKLPQQWHIDRISAKQAWDVVKGDSSMIIGIVDSGIERTHPDLNAAIWSNPGETGGGKETDGVDNDNNGFIDDWWGWDFSGSNGTNPDNSPVNQFEPHGTFVAGCAAASGDNSIGVAGVAYGCRLMSVKVTEDRKDPRLFNESEGVLYAAKMGARVINCSFGGLGKSRAEAELYDVVINTYGVVVVAAYGNNGREQQYFPASYPDVIAVAWTNQSDGRDDLSNYHFRVDISAPGTDIYSTINGDYFTDSGSSFASPQVAAAAALVRLRWPSLDPQHVVEVLRATSDDISANLATNELDKMGAGRLNLNKAVANGATIRSARMESYRIIDVGGDGVVDPGEEIRLELHIKNYLGAASGVTTLVEPVSPGIAPMDRPQVNFGAMASDESRITSDSAFNVTIPSNTPPNSDIVFRVTTITADRINRQYITVRVFPSYRTTDNNDVAVTFNSTGNIGYNGINRLEGVGFSYMGEKSILYHGGLMIGTDSAHLSDAVRLGPTSSGVADGFRLRSPYLLAFNIDSSLETGTATFSDAHRPDSLRVGVDVSMRTLQYRTSAARNFVIVSYAITNTSGADISGLRCGIYLDWDMSLNGLEDSIGYDADHRLGFMRANDASSPLYSGATLLSRQEVGFYAVDNGRDGPTTNFTPEKKWVTLASGIVNNPLIDDMGMTLSAGSIDLRADSTTVVSFAIMAANGFDSLQLAATEAERIYALLSSVPYRAEGITGVRLYPNPVTGQESTLGFDLSHPTRVGVKIYSVVGAMVGETKPRNYPEGARTIQLPCANLPSGVYIYRLTTGNESHSGQLIITN